MNLGTCIGCGCDDYNACELGCAWLRVDRGIGVGVCSNCESHLERWLNGDRQLSAEAKANLGEDELLEEFEDPDFSEFDGEPRGLILPGDPDYHL